MNKKQVKEKVEKIIQENMDEFGLEREEVLDVAMYNMVGEYIKSQITKEDLLMSGEYLGYELNMNEIEKRIKNNRKRKEQRQAKRMAKGENKQC